EARGDLRSEEGRFLRELEAAARDLEEARHGDRPEEEGRDGLAALHELGRLRRVPLVEEPAALLERRLVDLELRLEDELVQDSNVEGAKDRVDRAPREGGVPLLQTEDVEPRVAREARSDDDPLGRLRALRSEDRIGVGACRDV